jgi:hypothetical protein
MGYMVNAFQAPLLPCETLEGVILNENPSPRAYMWAIFLGKNICCSKHAKTDF